jgi:hypothetical protein
VLVRSAPVTIWTARALGLLVAGSGGYGVLAHVRANYAAGPLDFRYETRWASMSAPDRWWTAVSDTVGHSPTLAPGALALAAGCLVLATVGHPTLERSPLPGRQREETGPVPAPSAGGSGR